MKIDQMNNFKIGLKKAKYELYNEFSTGDYWYKFIIGTKIYFLLGVVIGILYYIVYLLQKVIFFPSRSIDNLLIDNTPFTTIILLYIIYFVLLFICYSRGKDRSKNILFFAKITTNKLSDISHALFGVLIGFFCFASFYYVITGSGNDIRFFIYPVIILILLVVLPYFMISTIEDDKVKKINTKFWHILIVIIIGISIFFCFLYSNGIPIKYTIKISKSSYLKLQKQSSIEGISVDDMLSKIINEQIDNYCLTEQSH